MFKDEINNFKRYKKEPNAISEGALYITTLKFQEKDKIIRVYLPFNYDENEAYPTIYMFDGQNMVDRYTTVYGEWNIDEEISLGIRNGRIKGLIAIGIDSPNDDKKRMEEMCPTLDNMISLYRKFITEEHLDELMEFIINEVKPLIDKNFATDKNKTLLGGSSMGGLASFVGHIKYNHIFNGALSFSPAFCLYENASLIENIKNINVNKIKKIYFFQGNTGYEKELYPAMNLVYNELDKLKIDDKIKYIFDSSGEHNENTWQKYFLDAIEYLLK